VYVNAQPRLIVLQLELEVMSLHDGLHQTHAEAVARSGAALFESKEALKDLFVLRFGNARATITELQTDIITVVFQCQLDVAGWGRVFDGIVQQVGQRLE
jgi:hypothetical protein